jgi:hypothetical protein
MWNMLCKVQFGYQLSICSRIEESHGKPWSILAVSGPSGRKLASSQQSGIKWANPNIIRYRAVVLFAKCLHICFYWLSFCVLTLDKHQTLVYNICEENMHMHSCEHTNNYICDCLNNGEFEYVLGWGDRKFYEVCCSSNNYKSITFLSVSYFL